MRGDNSPQPGQARTVGGRSGPQRPGHRSGQAERGRERASPRPAITQLLRILPEQPRDHRLPPLTPGHSGPSPLLSSSPLWAELRDNHGLRLNALHCSNPRSEVTAGTQAQRTPGSDPGLARGCLQTATALWRRALHAFSVAEGFACIVAEELMNKSLCQVSTWSETSGITPCPRPHPPQAAC